MKVLITGHSSLVSQAIALSRLTLGDEVYMTSRTLGNPFDPRIKLIAFDLQNPDVAAISSQNFQGVVLSAMSHTPAIKSFAKTPLDGEYLDFFRMNVEGNMHLLKAMLPSMVEKNLGRIVYISSMTVKHPMTGYSLYAAAKSAMESITASIAFEYGKSNITANTVRLGIVETERNRRYRERFHDEMVKNISLGRLATPQDIAELVDPLLSAKCYANGAIFEASGGLFIPN